jgi:hypothetical protein
VALVLDGDVALTAPLVAADAVAVPVLTVLGPLAIAGVEQADELEAEPFWRPAAPLPVELADLVEELVRPAAPVAGALTGPPASGSPRCLAFSEVAARSAVAAIFGAVETVASTAPAIAWMPVAAAGASLSRTGRCPWREATRVCAGC